eukprot:6003115-Pyramimonas_sp.AAC.1
MPEPDDFGAASGASAAHDASTKRPGPKDDQPARKWLKSFETVPCQLLNAYGQSRFPRMTDEQ